MLNKSAPNNLVKMFLWFTDHSISEEVESIIIAGGFIRAYYAGENPSDLDLYFRNNTDLLKTESELERNGWVNSFETDRAKTMKKDGKLIQLISYIYGEPDEVINLFDFTVCCAAMTLKKEEVDDEDLGEDEPRTKLIGEVILHDDFFEHLSGRILWFIGTPLPLSSLKRAFKYKDKGYHICDENILKIAEAIFRQVNFDDEGNLEEHIQGIDPNGGGIRAID